MKKIVAVFLTLIMLLSCGAVFSSFAAALGDDTQIGVKAKARYYFEGEYSAVIEGGGASVSLENGTSVTVTSAPEGAKKLIIAPIGEDEKDAWEWIRDCFDGVGTPNHAFAVLFADEHGERTPASGAQVTVTCSHCSKTAFICSLSSQGTAVPLGEGLTFDANGSTCYIVAEKKASEPIRYKVSVKDTNGGSVKVSDKTALAGETVVITPKPDSINVTDRVTVTDRSGNEIAVNDNGSGKYTFVQPESDVTVEVTFKNKGDDTPPMGDNNRLWLWMIAAALGTAVGAVAVIEGRKRNKA